MGFFDLFRPKKSEPESVIAAPVEPSPVRQLEERRAAQDKAWDQSFNYSVGVQGGEKFSGGIAASGSSFSLDHYSTRQNARRAMQESLEARAIVESFAANTIGSGLSLKPEPDHEALGMTKEQAGKWSRNTKKRYDRYAKDKKQHRSGTLTWYQYMSLYCLKQHRDNDVYTRFYYSNHSGLQNPLQFEGIDPNQIMGNSFTNSIYNEYEDQGEDGIFRDDAGQEVAYNVLIRRTGKYLKIPAIGAASGKIHMVHGFKPEYDGQGRGFSRLTPVLQELTNLTDYTLAAIQKAINQSNLVMSVENKQERPGNPFDDEGELTGGSAVGELEPTATAESSEQPKRAGMPEFIHRKEITQHIPGSTAFLLNEQGDEVKLLSNGSPGDQFQELVKSYLDRICSATGASSEVVQKIFRNNYTGIRATLVIFWRELNMWRAEIDSDLLTPHYESWLEGEIGKGTIIASGWYNADTRAAWMAHRFIGDPMPQSDPGREARALKSQLEMGMTTQEEAALNFNGSDWEDNAAQNAIAFPNSPSPPWSERMNENTNEKDEKDED